MHPSIAVGMYIQGVRRVGVNTVGGRRMDGESSKEVQTKLGTTRSSRRQPDLWQWQVAVHDGVKLGDWFGCFN